jgi:hypothetical protein
MEAPSGGAFSRLIQPLSALALSKPKGVSTPKNRARRIPQLGSVNAAG